MKMTIIPNNIHAYFASSSLQGCVVPKMEVNKRSIIRNRNMLPAYASTYRTLNVRTMCSNCGRSWLKSWSGAMNTI
jgi:hypothetical protein